MRLIRRLTAPAARRRPSPEFTWEDLATGTLPVLACFLGGATEKWAEGIVVGLLGVLLILNPPRFSLGPVFHAILIALIGCAALAFLPASWFFHPAWRGALVNDFGLKIAASVTPQPWITFGCLLSFLAGLAWLYYVCGIEVEIRAARRQLRVFAISVILIAALAIVLHRMHGALPFWHNQRGFGPFPNRNQTANLFGLTAIIILACGHDEIRRHKQRWVFWLAGFAIILVALVLNYSRAGLALLLVGCAIWLAILVVRTGSKGAIALGASALLILLTVLLVFGGATFERFNLRGGGTTVASDFRWLIFSDACALLRATPWCGIGLGNFEPVFAIFRDASIGQNRALHPESDWLWLCTEMGWPAAILIIAGAAVLIRRCFPFVEGTNQWFRTAALIASVLFGLHAIVDVGGHRVGTAYAGIFLFGMALRRPLQRPASVLLVAFFRAAGFALFVIGATWLIASYRNTPLPGGIGVDVERHLGKMANVGRQSNETILHANRGLEWGPLDWQLYFLRALGEVGTKRLTSDAIDDFRRARFLEPNSYQVAYQEGLAWMTREPLLTMTAWREALRRAGPERPGLYSLMFSTAMHADPAVTKMLTEYGSVQPDLVLTNLERVSGEPFTAALNQFLQHDPSLQTLTREQRGKLFALWSDRGDAAQLARALEEQPAWMPLAWRGVAKHRASQKDFRGAFELAQQYGSKPTLPEAAKGGSLEELQQQVHSTANNYGAGFALYQLQMQANKIDDALLTVRRFTSQPDAPAYFHFLEAEAWAAKGDWERAWNARQKFEAPSAKAEAAH